MDYLPTVVGSQVMWRMAILGGAFFGAVMFAFAVYEFRAHLNALRVLYLLGLAAASGLAFGAFAGLGLKFLAWRSGTEIKPVWRRPTLKNATLMLLGMAPNFAMVYSVAFVHPWFIWPGLACGAGAFFILQPRKAATRMGRVDAIRAIAALLAGMAAGLAVAMFMGAQPGVALSVYCAAYSTGWTLAQLAGLWLYYRLMPERNGTVS